MAHVRKGQLTAKTKCRKHLRPEGKRTHYGQERAAEKRMIEKDLEDNLLEFCTDCGCTLLEDEYMLCEMCRNLRK